MDHDGMGGSEQGMMPSKEAPSFKGTDQHGAPFDSGSMKGGPWLASFFFTSCGDVCPALNTVQAQLQKEFGDKVHFVSITTDPETDTQDALKAYADQYGAKDGTWWFVRMPFEEMRTVASQGFGVMDPQEPAMHSTRFIAVDASMQIAGYFDSSEQKDIDKLRTWINSQL